MKIIINKDTKIKFGIVICVVIISGLIFASLAEGLVNRETLSIFDPRFGSWLIAHTSVWGDYFFSLITFLGNFLVISAGTSFAGFWLVKKKMWSKFYFLFGVVGGSAMLNLLLKNIFQRARPVYPQPFMIDTGYSFPSGHAMISLAFYGAIAYVLFFLLKNKRQKTLVIVGAGLISALVGFSRLYLGVHYLTDVLAGWAAGGLCLSGGIFVEFLYHSSIFHKIPPKQES